MIYKKFIYSSVILLSILLVASTALVDISKARASIKDEKLKWTACGSGGQCARLIVPLDDTISGGPTIKLALARVKARDPEKRIGALVVNPGGPGAPGAQFALDFAASLPEVIQDRFDIVGFDPRGTGKSAGVDCTDDFDSIYALDWAPDTEFARTQLEEGFRNLANACSKSDGDKLPFLSTRRAARDLDLIRAALGEKRLTYLGYSYGSYLGAQYANQYPDRVRALVLDGAVDPSLDSQSLQVQQSEAFENSLNLFLQDCSESTDCAFHKNGESASAYDKRRTRVGEIPLTVNDGEKRKLNGTLFDIGVSQILYEGEDGWATLASALAAADEGDGAELLFYSDLYTGRLGKGSYDNLTESFFGVGCIDGPDVGGIEGIRRIESAAAAAAPRLGRSIVNNSLVCAFWPVAAEPLVALPAQTNKPILVIGTRNDPATPLAWAEGLTKELGNAVLVTTEGARHTAYASGKGCVDNLVNRYLISTKAPKIGTRC